LFGGVGVEVSYEKGDLKDIERFQGGKLGCGDFKPPICA